MSPRLFILGRPFAATALPLAACLVLAAGEARAQDAVPIDGIAALVGISAEDEGTSEILLESDVALVEALADAVGGVAEEARGRRALERAILITLLARQAKLAGDEVDATARRAIIDRMIRRLGDRSRLDALLARFGAGEPELLRWVDALSLAARQIEYMRERTEPPTEKELRDFHARGDHPLRQEPFEAVSQKLRAIVVSRAVVAQLSELLSQAIARGAVRIVRR